MDIRQICFYVVLIGYATGSVFWAGAYVAVCGTRVENGEDRWRWDMLGELALCMLFWPMSVAVVLSDRHGWTRL